MNPFVGPRPFGRNYEDQFRFFGRNYETGEIVTLIYSHQLILIYAQSGAGKTSILNAQVSPELENNGFEVLPVARVGISASVADVNTPQQSNINFDASNHYIFNALYSMKPDIDAKLLSNKSLSDYLNEYFPTKMDSYGNPIPQVIVFDQLEELFNVFPKRWHEEQVGFFKQVAEALNKNSLLRVVFVIREDYLAQLDPFARMLPEKLRPRFRLERLRKDSALLAIKGPLERANATFDMKEIDKIVQDLLKMRVETIDGTSAEVVGEYIEPIQLQVVCQRWWRERFSSKDIKSNPDYLADLADVDKALEDFYVNSIHQAEMQTGVSDGKIRKWCESNLITSSETRSIIHLEPNKTKGIPNKAIEVLVDNYLIRREWRSGAPWYELTHDRLIKPIKSSNAKWKNAKDRKRNRKVIITSGLVGAAATIIIIIALANVYSAPPPAPTVIIDQRTVTVDQRIVSVGVSPMSVAINPNTNMVYVANYGSNTISIVNDTTNRVVETVPVGESPGGVAVNPNTNMVYVANEGSNSTSIIDGTTNRVVDTVPVGESPYGVAVNPKINLIYVSNLYSVSIINGTTNNVVDTGPVGESLTGVAVNPNTNMVYVADYGSNSTSIIGGTTNLLVTTIPVGNHPTGVAVNPNTNMVYVANEGSNTTSVIDGTTYTVVAYITVDELPAGVAVNPNTNMVYVANYGSNTVSIINGTTNNVTTSIVIGGAPSDVSVNPKTNTIYVANKMDNTLSIIATTSTAPAPTNMR